MPRTFTSTEPQHGDDLNTILAKRLQKLGGSARWGATDEELQEEISKISVSTTTQVTEQITNVMNEIDLVQTSTEASFSALDVEAAGASEISGDVWVFRGSGHTSTVGYPEWSSVAYGNGLFVAVSNLGRKAHTSPDGITWTLNSATGVTGTDFKGITFGNGKFVAVGSNAVMTSTDGLTWASQTPSANRAWKAVTFGAGIFVAVAGNGGGVDVMWSTDGVAWNSVTSGSAGVWNSVTFGGGKFVAVSQNGTGNKVISSSDGAVWAENSGAADNNWTGVSYGAGLFVAVSDTGTNRVMTSPNGTAWTPRTSETGVTAYDWLSIAYGAGRFVALAGSTGNHSMTSPNGIDWTDRASPNSGYGWNSVVYAQGVFVAVGGPTKGWIATSGIFGSSEIIPNQNVLKDFVWSVAGIPEEVTVPTQAGGIPTNRTTIHQTFNPGATATQIRDAINSCPLGKYVKLNAGTYNISGITIGYHDNWVLRGAGMGQTILKFTQSGGTAFSIGGGPPWDGGWANTTNITAGGLQGGTAITVASTDGYAVGDQAVIDQNNTPWIAYGGSDAASPPGQNSDSSGRLRDGTRLQMHYCRITSAAPGSLTFWPPLPYTLELARAPQITRQNDIGNGSYYKGPKFSGIEDLTMDFTGCTNSAKAFVLVGSHGFWLKNVEMKAWDYFAAVWVRKSSCFEMRGCFIHDPRTFAINYGYGVQLDPASGSLIIDNIIYRCMSNFLLQSGCGGNVIAYNASCFGHYVNGGETGAWLQHDISGNHTPFPSHNLFEGNYTSAFQSDYYYGPSGNSTVFRNRIPGNSAETTKHRFAVSIDARQRYYSVVGNQLGELTAPSSVTLAKAGVTRTYTQPGTITWTGYDPGSAVFGDSESYIYRLGYPMSGSNGSTASAWQQHDQLVKTGTIRHGNWDAYTQQQTPSGDGIVWDATIDNHNVPDSLFLDAAPSFFNSLTWPPYGPTAPTSVVTDLEKIPAGYRLVHNLDPA